MAREGNDMNLLAQCLGNKGVVYREKGNLSKALSLHDQQRKIYEEYGGRKSLNTVLCQQALVYEELGRVDDALESYGESEALSREINDLYWLEFSLARQGHIRFGREDYERALVCYDECETLNERMGNSDGLRIVLEWQINTLEQLQDDRKLESKRRKLSRLDVET
jgi:tetratricopeptide (TPR) repeat protein